MESRRLLGLVLALGIVAGAAGGFVMTRAGTSAQGAQAAVEASPAVEAQAHRCAPRAGGNRGAQAAG